MTMQWHGPQSHLREWVEVSRGARTAFTWIASNPLISKSILSLLMGYSDAYSYPLVKELEDAELLSSVRLGGVRGKADRLFIAPYGRQFLSSADRSWQEDGGRSLLLARFPVTEALQLAAASVEGMGKLIRFNWYQGLAWDVAIRFEKGLVLSHAGNRGI